MGDADELKTVLRLPAKTASRVDEYVAARNAAGEGARISRNAAIVVLLEKALDAIQPPAANSQAKKAAGRR
jgi:hypothetical protein